MGLLRSFLCNEPDRVNSHDIRRRCSLQRRLPRRMKTAAMIYVFAYGSNMLLERVRASNRAPGAEFAGAVSVKGRRLAFRKKSVDGSGKCDIPPTGNPSDVVHGVLFKVPGDQMPALDKEEGLGKGYLKETITVTLADGTAMEALTYVADPSRVDDALRPFDWYLGLVKAGAAQHRLPKEYLAALDRIDAVEDPEVDRRAKLEAETALRAYAVARDGISALP